MTGRAAPQPPWRSLLLPGVLTLVGLAVLLTLGKWQLDRREWKLGLIERIEARAHAEPISLLEAFRRWERDHDVEYYRVKLAGRFLHEYERHHYGIVDGEAGWKVITPFENEADGSVLLVDRGFVPEPFRDPATRAAGQIAGRVELVALARAPGAPSLFTPDNQPAANRWFWRDVTGMQAALPPQIATWVMPFMAEAEKVDVPGGWPRSGVTMLALPNRHLEYAMTWFGLAATLLGVFAVFVAGRLRDPGPQGYDAKIADRDAGV
jgi:surfeit locus 1 family protein